MMRRIFVALPLPHNLQIELSQVQREYPELPAKWVRPKNLHITLAFLGNKSEEEIGRICNIVKEIARNHSSFQLLLEKIQYGPPENTPRMVWATGRAEKELTSLVKEIREALSESHTTITLHITLARINQWKFQRIPEEEQINISKEINIILHVQSIVVMESFIKREGPEYTLIQEIKLA